MQTRQTDRQTCRQTDRHADRRALFLWADGQLRRGRQKQGELASMHLRGVKTTVSPLGEGLTGGDILVK